MKPWKFLILAAGLASVIGHAQTSDFAPVNLSSVIFNGTIASATGGGIGSGSISSLFASNGIDYALSPNGTLSEPTPFTYTKTGASTGRITEAAFGAVPSVSVALTFSSATNGSFVATYGDNSTESGSFTLAPIAFASPLTNVSTRTTLAAGGTATTGFVVGGSGSRRVLVRAVGPGITQFGVTNALANPSITVFRGSTQIGANDDFSAGANVDATLPQQFTRVGAFPLTAGSRDAALITTLEAGPYTAQVRGGAATETGDVLLEVYFLD